MSATSPWLDVRLDAGWLPTGHRVGGLGRNPDLIILIICDRGAQSLEIRCAHQAMNELSTKGPGPHKIILCM
jgi:hypothetical protein